MYLCAWQRHCMWVSRHLLSSNVWNIVGGTVDKVETGALTLRVDIVRYYATLDRDERQRTTQIEELTIKMLGSKARPQMKLNVMDRKWGG